MKYFQKIIILLSLIFPSLIYADFEWRSYTLDNDLFLGKDNGYTNGFYFSFYDVENNNTKPQASWILKPLLWSLSEKDSTKIINSYTIGQMMMTPEDISLKELSQNDISYAGLLFINNTYLSIR